MAKTAIILGGGAKPKLFKQTLSKNPKAEVWGVNMQFGWRDWVRHDRMFNIHRYQLLRQYGWPTEEFALWAYDHPNARVIVADRWPGKMMARAEIFPRKRLQAFPRGDYHVNSLDWLIAYALLEKFTTVVLHGWSLEREGVMEQVSSPKCAEYWAGYATGRGMKVVVAADSAMFGVYHLTLTNRVYGYDDCPAWEDRRPGAKGVPYRYDGK